MVQLNITDIWNGGTTSRTLQLDIHPLIKTLCMEHMITGRDHKRSLVTIVNWSHADRTIRFQRDILQMTFLCDSHSGGDGVIVILLGSQEGRQYLVRVVHLLHEQQQSLLSTNAPTPTCTNTHITSLIPKFMGISTAVNMRSML